MPVLIELTSGAGLLLSIILFFHPKKINVAANRWLGVFVFTMALAILEISLFRMNFNLSHPKLFEIIGLLRYLTAPALYLAVVNFTSIYHNFNRSHLIHFIPFLFIMIFRVPFFITGHNPELQESTKWIILGAIQLILPLQAIFYWTMSINILLKHRKSVDQFSADAIRIDLRWLQIFLFIVLMIMIIWFNLLYFDFQTGVQWTPLLYLIAVYFLAYFSLRQSEIFEFTEDEKKDLSQVDIISFSQARHKRLEEGKMIVLSEKLEILMSTDKIYLDNELTLPKLAIRLNATANEISYVINESKGDNFYNYVNSYRIKEAQRLLLSDLIHTSTIAGIALQSGFNSKTSFNTAFKKKTGLSPTEFIRLHSKGRD